MYCCAVAIQTQLTAEQSYLTAKTKDNELVSGCHFHLKWYLCSHSPTVSMEYHFKWK